NAARSPFCGPSYRFRRRWPFQKPPLSAPIAPCISRTRVHLKPVMPLLCCSRHPLASDPVPSAVSRFHYSTPYLRCPLLLPLLALLRAPASPCGQLPRVIAADPFARPMTAKSSSSPAQIHPMPCAMTLALGCSSLAMLP